MKNRLFCPCLMLALIFSAARAEEELPPLHIDAERLQSTNGKTVAEGNVEARFEGYKLCAGNIEYDRNTGLIKAVNNVRLVHGGSEITGDSAHYNTQSGSGEITPFSANIKEKRLRFSGERAQWKKSGLATQHTSITSCPVDAEDWRLLAGELEIMEEEQQFIAKNVVLRLADVPVLYLPYGRFYYGEEKHSGFLPPDLRLSRGSGAGFSLPYYWALADNYDFTLTPNYRSHHGVELGGEFRFLTAHSSGSLQVATALLNNEGRGRENLSYEYQRDKWRLHVEAENVSDDDYLHDYLDSDAQSTRTLPRTASLHYEQDNFYARLAVEHFQSLDDSLTPPHHAMPQIDVGGSGGGDSYQWQTSWQYANFRHSTASDGSRQVLRTAASSHYNIGDFSLSPGAGAHAAYYNDDKDARFIVPYARLDAEKNSHPNIANGKKDHLRLRAALVYAPVNKRQNDALLYDTDVRTQTSENLFEENRFIGDDRVADAQFIAYGGSYHLFNGDDELFFIGIAQRYHFKDAEISLPSNDTPPQQGFGNILLNSRLQLDNTWKMAAAAEWDAHNNTMQHFYTEIHGRFDDARLVHLRYLADADESLVVGAALPLTDWLEIAAESDYLLNEDRFSRNDLAVRLRDSCDCWKISFTISDTVVEEGDNETDFSFGITFTGLGNIGSDYEKILNKLR